jgi:hypothetical protein
MATRMSKRINQYKGSFYESDQEDNKKDPDYNPNEFYENLKKQRYLDQLAVLESELVEYSIRETKERAEKADAEINQAQISEPLDRDDDISINRLNELFERLSLDEKEKEKE